uniref:Tick transposon n=1 Tax=Rhipicephalus appendiculatus TaxID=34631 RepID=A0A131Z227_RHIAP
MCFIITDTELTPLELTTEYPSDNRLRFLDLELSFSNNHVCWGYAPRSQKSLLPFSSAHSKIVKRGIARACMKAALERSCDHQVEASFSSQVARLKLAGFPKTLLTSIAESLVSGFKNKCSTAVQSATPPQQSVAVIPYVHKVAHNLKKVVSRAGVRLLFSARNKLGSLCQQVNRETKTKRCSKKHRQKFVECCEGVVYKIPLSCGRYYVGQTGRCANDRMRENFLPAEICSTTDRIFNPKKPEVRNGFAKKPIFPRISV